MIALNGKSNLRDSVEFGFLEVARSQQPNHARRPFGCFPKGWLSRDCRGSRGKTPGNHGQKMNAEEKLALVLHCKLADSPRKASAPVKGDELIQLSV